MVTSLQKQIDPTSDVIHNESIVDRLGHSRQFDVVIRGKFAGHQMLGVIECKDLNRKVGNPEVDAFVTKAQDINANFKILMSKSGFSKPAIEKCAHYGIQPLSLLNNDPINRKFFIGTRWTADVKQWKHISVQLHFVEQPSVPAVFDVGELRINGKRVLDWYTNYLLDHEAEFTEFGWTAGVQITFETHQLVQTDPNTELLCSGMSFCAELVLEKLERLVGINGTGFFNWNTKEATFPAGSTIMTDGVSMDFSQWVPRNDEKWKPSGFIEIHLCATSLLFERVENVIGLDIL